MIGAHLPVLPIVLPLAAAGLLLLLERRSMRLQRVVALAATGVQLLVAMQLLRAADSGVIEVYLLGNWPARIGIALAVDRLSALLVLTTVLLGLIGLIHACSGWDRRAPHFHALFQVELMGLAGAFLTADVFNLFVFFEVLLIASYGLLLSGGRGARLRAGIHYVAFNISASTLYLFAVGMLYGLLGALNLGEMAVRVAAAPAAQQPLIAAAGGLLLLVFTAKAALFPLAFWLPGTYSRTPVAALILFAMMTKLGVYCVLRVAGVLFGADAGALAGMAWPALLWLGGIGFALASLGAIAAANLRLLCAYLVIASAATLFIAVAADQPAVTAAALYYLLHSALATAALFVLADLVRKRRPQAGDSLRQLDHLPQRGTLATVYVLLAIALIGLPPLSGFVGKLGLLAALPAPLASWAWPLLLVGSLLTLLALAHAGSQLFWRQPAEPATVTTAPDGNDSGERWALYSLLGLLLLLSFAAAPVLRYTGAAAGQLHQGRQYIDALRHAEPFAPGTEPGR